jgi:hypothetical protein
VTASTYVAQAKAYITAAGEPFTIARTDKVAHGVGATPEQWGAWRAFFVRIGMPARFLRLFDSHDTWATPSEWPHHFSDAATLEGDFSEGRLFVSSERMRHAEEKRCELSPAAQDWLAGGKR